MNQGHNSYGYPQQNYPPQPHQQPQPQAQFNRGLVAMRKPINQHEYKQPSPANPYNQPLPNNYLQPNNYPQPTNPQLNAPKPSPYTGGIQAPENSVQTLYGRLESLSQFGASTNYLGFLGIPNIGNSCYMYLIVTVATQRCRCYTISKTSEP